MGSDFDVFQCKFPNPTDLMDHAANFKAQTDQSLSVNLQNPTDIMDHVAIFKAEMNQISMFSIVGIINYKRRWLLILQPTKAEMLSAQQPTRLKAPWMVTFASCIKEQPLNLMQLHRRKERYVQQHDPCSTIYAAISRFHSSVALIYCKTRRWLNCFVNWVKDYLPSLA
ncbi:hypothetical protein O6H91_12G070300 [Diphasiastrum complanatum]|uniref:Uncharacterized protein n=2 Tax=Diphasiastrum complanatum TaxID=34168 RepID=A0ACC2C3A7_DIPCM|nr:hypothetical protein O6H91_12G069600 [Diphasiastrum complanatum]KAJ7536456.1 hypothetical protein O6H91_12G070300 [Diphasiastrum complanatum]